MKERVQQEQDRTTVLESHGANIITVTGLLIAATAGIVGLLKAQTGFAAIPLGTEVAVVIGFAFFVLAVLAGIASNWPLSSAIFNDEDIIAAIQKNWDDPADSMPQAVWLRRALNVDQAMKENDVKARQVRLGMAFQILAFISLAIGAGILSVSPPASGS